MIILTSSVASVAEHVYKNYLKDKGYKSILFVDTASEPVIKHGDDWLQADLKSLIDQGYRVDRYSITDKSRADVESKIDDYDILYMCGGNTEYLLKQMQITDTLTLIANKVKEGKTYIGTSAGSIIAGPYLPDYLLEDGPEPRDRICLNLVNFIIAPHWGSEHFKEDYLGVRIKTIYTESQHPFILLTDHQYIAVEDTGKLQIVDTFHK